MSDDRPKLQDKLAKRANRQTTALVRQTGDVGDIFSGLRHRDLVQFRAGVYALASHIPGLKKAVFRKTSPVEILEGIQSHLHEELVGLERNIVKARNRMVDIDLDVRAYRRTIQRSEMLMPEYTKKEEDGAETGRIPVLRGRVAEIDSTLTALGYDATDPNLIMTGEMKPLVDERIDADAKLRRYELRYSTHKARTHHRRYGIQNLHTIKGNLEKSINAAEQKRIAAKVRLHTSTAETRAMAINYKLQEATFGTHDTEMTLNRGTEAMLVLLAKANQDLVTVLEESYLPPVREEVLAYVDRLAAHTGEAIKQLAANAPTRPALQAAYTLLGLSKGATAQEVQDRYHELARNAHPDVPDGDNNHMVELNSAYRLLVPDAKEIETPLLGAGDGSN